MDEAHRVAAKVAEMRERIITPEVRDMLARHEAGGYSANCPTCIASFALEEVARKEDQHPAYLLGYCMAALDDVQKNRTQCAKHRPKRKAAKRGSP